MSAAAVIAVNIEAIFINAFGLDLGVKIMKKDAQQCASAGFIPPEDKKCHNLGDRRLKAKMLVSRLRDFVNFTRC